MKLMIFLNLILIMAILVLGINTRSKLEMIIERTETLRPLYNVSTEFIIIKTDESDFDLKELSK